MINKLERPDSTQAGYSRAHALSHYVALLFKTQRSDSQKQQNNCPKPKHPRTRIYLHLPIRIHYLENSQPPTPRLQGSPLLYVQERRTHQQLWWPSHLWRGLEIGFVARVASGAPLACSLFSVKLTLCYMLNKGEHPFCCGCHSLHTGKPGPPVS